MSNPDVYSGELVNVEGTLVERDALHIAEMIHEYDPNLRLQYLEMAAAVGEPPFRVIEKCRDGVDRVAFTAWQLDQRLIDRVMAADCAKHDLNAVLDAKNQKAREDRNRRYREKMEEAHELAHDVFSSPKSTYTAKIDGKIVKFQ